MGVYPLEDYWGDDEEEVDEEELPEEDFTAEEVARLVAAGRLHQCVDCGCTELTPCPGGCVWAKPNLCSRCFLAES